MLKFHNHTNGRYYYLQVEKDMFGHVLVIIRGGNNVRRVLRVAANSKREISKTIARLTERRLARGYTLVE